MLLDNRPFISFNGRITRPYLAVNIINLNTGKNHHTFGLIDTGADECAVPAYIAHLLGHNFEAGTPKIVTTGSGATRAYRHITTVEIYHPLLGKLLYTVSNTPVDFMLNLPVVLLGVNNFLSRFVLKIDYPNSFFL